MYQKERTEQQPKQKYSDKPGSYQQGDTAAAILGIAKVQNDRCFIVEWNKRPNGERPFPSLVSIEFQFRYRDPEMLIDYFMPHMTMEMPNGRKKIIKASERAFGEAAEIRYVSEQDSNRKTERREVAIEKSDDSANYQKHSKWSEKEKPGYSKQLVELNESDSEPEVEEAKSAIDKRPTIPQKRKHPQDSLERRYDVSPNNLQRSSIGKSKKGFVRCNREIEKRDSETLYAMEGTVPIISSRILLDLSNEYGAAKSRPSNDPF